MDKKKQLEAWKDTLARYGEIKKALEGLPKVIERGLRPFTEVEKYDAAIMALSQGIRSTGNPVVGIRPCFFCNWYVVGNDYSKEQGDLVMAHISETKPGYTDDLGWMYDGCFEFCEYGLVAGFCPSDESDWIGLSESLRDEDLVLFAVILDVMINKMEKEVERLEARHERS